MKSVLYIIDAQNDFCTPGGSLCCANAEPAVRNIIDLLKNNEFDSVACTKDSHDDLYLKTIEGKHLPIKHCIYHTDGWKINQDIYNALYHQKEWLSQEKEQFMLDDYQIEDAFDDMYIEDEEDVKIYVCGFATDICVLNNALILKRHFSNKAEIYVISDCCAGTSEEMHNKALDIMKVNHINVIDKL